MTSEPSSLFVWNVLPGNPDPVLAGRLDRVATPGGTVGTFVYGRSYLDRANSLPLDPVALPLTPGARTVTALGGYPAALLDACPDRWGIKVIDRLLGNQPFPADP